MTSPRPLRVAWLDLLRIFCAAEIVGFHWLRACVKAGVLAQEAPANFITEYRQHSWGLAGFRHLLLDHSPHQIVRFLNDTTGVVFGFGWEAVHVFVLISGFSLTLGLRDRLSTAEWRQWFAKRIKRIVFPFYLVALPLAAMMAALAALPRGVVGGVLARFQEKLLGNGAADLFGLLVSQVLLFDPRKPLFTPVFVSPAWWFVPAILVGYLVFPFLWVSIRKIGAPAVLLTALGVSVTSYIAVQHAQLIEFSWGFVALNEIFNFCLGIALGRFYSSPDGRRLIDRLVASNYVLAAGIGLAVAGNSVNQYAAGYPFSSLFFTVGLAICGARLALSVSTFKWPALVSGLDPFLIYLLHQPFAFPLAFGLVKLTGALTPSLGILLYFGLVWQLTVLFGSAYRWILRPRARANDSEVFASSSPNRTERVGFARP